MGGDDFFGRVSTNLLGWILIPFLDLQIDSTWGIQHFWMDFSFEKNISRDGGLGGKTPLFFFGVGWGGKRKKGVGGRKDLLEGFFGGCWGERVGSSNLFFSDKSSSRTSVF